MMENSNNKSALPQITDILKNQRNLKERARKKPKPTEMILQGLARGVIANLSGTASVGKSTLIYQAALEAAGYTFTVSGLKGNQERIRVAYFPAEDPESPSWHKDYYFLNRLTETDLDDISEKFVINDLYNETPDITSEYWIQYIRYYAERFDLIIIDTLRCFHNKNEVSDEAMNEILDAMRSIIKDTKSSILFIHHTNKDAEKHGVAALHSSRGSSVLSCDPKWLAVMLPATEDQLKEHGVDIKFEDVSNYCSLKLVKENFSNSKANYLYKRVSDKKYGTEGFHFEIIEKSDAKPPKENKTKRIINKGFNVRNEEE